MSGTIFVGIDNGVSGSLAFLNGKDFKVYPMPKKKYRHYSKKEKYMHRIDFKELKSLLDRAVVGSPQLFIFMEQPFSGASANASYGQRAFEATLIALEEADYPTPTIVYSKTWQKEILGVTKSKETKIASRKIGETLYPGSAVNGDCDAILIAHWARLKGGKM